MVTRNRTLGALEEIDPGSGNYVSRSKFFQLKEQLLHRLRSERSHKLIFNILRCSEATDFGIFIFPNFGS